MLLTRRLLAGCAAALGAAGCSPLQLFNAVNPSDPGVAKVASATFGPDPRQALDIYAPTRPTNQALPVAIFFYGGSWESGSRTDYAFAGQALAAKGFVAAVPDYRLYPQVRFPAFLEDGAAAIRWVADHIAQHGGDPARIVLIGHSAGAYNAAMLALDTRYLKRAGVDPRIVRGFAGLSGPYDFLPFDTETSLKVFGAAPDKEATQPVTFARPGIAAFLATGDADETVKPRNTASLAARLRRSGGRVEERLYPGLDHRDTLLALSVLFRGKAPILAEMAQFLKEAAGDAPMIRPRSGP